MRLFDGAQRLPLLVGVALIIFAAALELQRPLTGLHDNWIAGYGHLAHGYLTLLMALWLAWNGWQSRPALLLKPWWPALAVLGVLLVMLAVSMVAAVETVVESLVPLIALAALAAGFGWQVARLLAWPILYVMFAVPIWWVLNAPLQWLTVMVVNHLVAWTGVPAYVEGNFFHLPAGTMEIAALCSGLNYFMVALSLAAFQGLLYLRGWGNRFKLLAMAAILAVLCNWVRIYSLLLVGYFSEMRNYLIRVEHIYFGWILFLLFIWPVFFYGRRLETGEHRQGVQAMSPARSGLDEVHGGACFAACVAVALLLLSVGPLQHVLRAAGLAELR